MHNSNIQKKSTWENLTLTIKTLRKLGRNYLNMIKKIYQKKRKNAKTNILLNGKSRNAFPLKMDTGQAHSLRILILLTTGSSSYFTLQEKDIRGIQTGEEEVKWSLKEKNKSLFTGVCDNLWRPTQVITKRKIKSLPEQASKLQGHTIQDETKESVASLHTNTKQWRK